MADPYAERTSSSLAASGQSAVIGPGRSVNVSLYGTWVGTVKLQRKVNGDWRDIEAASWTANVSTIGMVGANPHLVRLDFTRTSGTLEYTLEMGPSAV